MDSNSKSFVFLPLFYQIIRFGLVGGLAAAIHFAVVIGLVEATLAKPLVANMLAFLVAFQVSYWGHRCWTFNAKTIYHYTALLRLFAVAISGFILNQSLFFVLFTMFKLPYQLALLIVLAILPILTFTLGKCWVFR